VSCGHGGYHGCGEWHGGLWYGPPAEVDRDARADWYEAARPMPRGRGRDRWEERAISAGELEARLVELRDEMRRVQSELSGLRRPEAASDDGA